VIGADRADEIDLPGAAHPGDLCSERFGELNGVGAYASRCPDDQYRLSGLDTPGVPQALECGERGDRNHGGLLEAEVGWLVGELVLSCRCALSEGAPADAEDLVAGLEPGHTEPDRDHRAGHVPPRHRVLRTTKPQAHGPHQVGLAG